MTFTLCGISALSSRTVIDAFCFPKLAKEILIFKINDTSEASGLGIMATWLYWESCLCSDHELP